MPEFVFDSVKLPVLCWTSLQKKPDGAATPLSVLVCGLSPPPVPPLLKSHKLFGVAVPVGVAVLVGVAVFVGVEVLVAVAPDAIGTPFKMMPMPWALRPVSDLESVELKLKSVRALALR